MTKKSGDHTTTKKQEPPTREEMQAMLQEDCRRQEDLCRAGIAALLEKHSCNLDAVVVLRRGQVDSQVIVSARAET